jgi:hypothetical protein
MFGKDAKTCMTRCDPAGQQLTSLTSEFWHYRTNSLFIRLIRLLKLRMLPTQLSRVTYGSAWYGNFHWRWIPHELTASLRQVRMETYRELLPILQIHEKNNIQRFVTGDESWFALEFHHSTKWSVSRDNVPQKVKQQTGTQNFMLAVIWTIDGFHVVDLVTEQHNYNTQYFLSHSLEPLLLAVFPDDRKPHSRRLGLQLDNCRVHCSKAFVTGSGACRNATLSKLLNSCVSSSDNESR